MTRNVHNVRGLSVGCTDDSRGCLCANIDGIFTAVPVLHAGNTIDIELPSISRKNMERLKTMNWIWEWWNQEDLNKENGPYQRKETKTVNELWLEYFAEHLHVWPFEELCSRLETDAFLGLSEEVAKQRLSRNGKNTFGFPAQRKSALWKLLDNCFCCFAIIILLMATICFILYHVECKQHPNTTVDPEYLVAGIFLLLILLLSSGLILLQRNDESAVVKAFEDMMPMYCTVIRDGEKQVILSENVVQGDVLPIAYGQRLPADLRFFSSIGLELNNVSLTGLSRPVDISHLVREGLPKHSEVKVAVA
ncbi:sodium/potassium-transporting ATPase subunit alpha-A [Drosophila obscura]|uniref:sodium/potassium-transporting ATPase subunit alpha-A n=1 Tax=Drosophila obscura TaxID=7282 RepID=UPI001BB1758E|nr:sodium/potassium-transporting ATPase subunit alpha-A [Drosophila obscura]